MFNLTTHLAIKTLIDFGVIIDSLTVRQGSVSELILKIFWDGEEYIFFGDDALEQAAKMVLNSCIGEIEETFKNMA